MLSRATRNVASNIFTVETELALSSTMGDSLNVRLGGDGKTAAIAKGLL
jgi:hypothetical protein